MPGEPPSTGAQLTILAGQVKALREHLEDDSRSCAEVAHLVTIIDGAWRKVRAAVLRGYVEDCLIEVERDERTRALLEAVERIGRR